MEDSDFGHTYEWETEFLEWINRKKVEKIEEDNTFSDYPQIKLNYSENFVLQNILDEK